MMRRIGKTASALALAAVLAGGLASCGPPSVESANARLDREADNDPVIGAIREADPTLYARIRDEASTLMSQGATIEQARDAAHRAGRTYIGQQMGAIASAPSEAQLAAFTSERDLLQVLHGVDIEACANAAMGAPGEDGAAAGNEQVGEAMGNAIGARLAAASAGRAHPTRHDAAQPADALAVREAMIRNGLDERMVDSLMGGAINSLSSQQKCEGTIAFSDAILEQPAASRDRLVSLIFTSLAQQSGAAAP